MYYDTDLATIVKDSARQGANLPKVSLGRAPSLVEYAQALTASANAEVGPARHASFAAVKEVVIRETNARVGQPKKTAYFGIIRAVENFLSVATKNLSSTPHVDMLPLGHPLRPVGDSITASVLTFERAQWEAGTLDADPRLHTLVASVLSNDPSSVEYKFAATRLKASAPDVFARIAKSV